MVLLQLSCRSRLVFTLLGREHIRLIQGKAALGSEPEKPLKIHGLQERIDQLEERTPNRAHSELLSQQMGVMQERMNAFSAMRTSAASSLHRIPAGIGQDEALQQHEQDQHRQD